MPKTVTNEVFILSEFYEEPVIEMMIIDAGYDISKTTWKYSWSVPEWVGEDRRKNIIQTLELSDYSKYLVVVKQES